MSVSMPRHEERDAVTAVFRALRRTLPIAIGVLALAACPSSGSTQAQSRPVTDWPVHSTARPQPPIVAPPPFSSSAPPTDAIVLFDGRSLDAWRSADRPDAPARWKVENGYMEVARGTGCIGTVRSFGDVQLHIEWSAPASPTAEGQNRGNSGVFLMERYEVQVLDSYRSETYPDGQAAAIYGQFPPLVNASRPPGEWQSYDIVFRAPRFEGDGKLLSPARMTVIHNGIVVHNNVELTGPTAHQARPPYEAHAERLRITLQDHGDPVRFRNVWVRDLGS